MSDCEIVVCQIICGCNCLKNVIQAVNNKIALFKQDDCFTITGSQLDAL